MCARACFVTVVMASVCVWFCFVTVAVASVCVVTGSDTLDETQHSRHGRLREVAVGA